MSQVARCSLNTARLVLMIIFIAIVSQRPRIAHAADAALIPITVLSTGWTMQDQAKAPQTGDAVSQTNFAAADWYKATVPGTVLTTLVNNGVYPEPLYGENNRTIPDTLCRTNYWYRNQFTVPADYAGRHIWLNFDGINYKANVWVNGQKAGEIHGAFTRGIFDITLLVAPGQPAALAVEILPPPHPGIPLEQTVINGTGPNGGILSEDGPTFLCTIGWDWIMGIRDRDMGIWQRVFLSCTGPLVIKDPLVTSDLPLPKTDSADLTLQATIENVTDAPQTGAFSFTLDGATVSSPISLAARESKTLNFDRNTTPSLHIANPKLWWPNGYGPQNLDSFHLVVTCAGATSDTQDVQFGIRKITYTVPDSENLTLSVNGVKIICKGGDWGMDEAMKRNPRQRLEAQIRMHALANYNMIRNWVGQSTSEDFYDLCDRYGIMLWDEFFQPNPSDGPNVLDTEMYLANVREKVLRFRNHPCIALWCGRNEGEPAPQAVLDGLVAIMKELEPLRHFQPSSTDGAGVRSNGPYCWRTPQEYFTFPMDGPGVEAFKTELGSVSIPTMEAIQNMMPAMDWQNLTEALNDDFAQHDLCWGAQSPKDNMYPTVLTSRYGAWAGLPQFVREAQLANYEAFRAMYEGRFAYMFQPCTGVLTWMSNCSQPSMVWQLYSYDLEPNSSLFATRKACENVHIQLNQDDYGISVINHTPVMMDNLKAWVRIINLDGSVAYDRQFPAKALPTSANYVGTFTWPDASKLSPVVFVKLVLLDGANNVVSDNFYWQALPSHVTDFTSLQTLPQVKLDASITRRDANGKCLLDVTLRNPAKVVALMAHVQLRRQTTGDRVLPVYYTDNYISLLPDESATFTIEADAKDLAGQNPLLALDGWNTTIDPQTFTAGGPSAIAPNTAAIVKPRPAAQP